MNIEQAKQLILQAGQFFNSQQSGYASWGKVEVLQIAVRTEGNRYVSSDPLKRISDVQTQDIRADDETDGLFGRIFRHRNQIEVILITQQAYASQIDEEIPAILDDQAQLLGVSIKKAKSESQITASIKGRYAAILPDNHCLCIGRTLEDAYVAAQLLEKTAKVYIESGPLGGARPIHKIEAWFMQQYYLWKYSKETEKNR